MSQEVQLTDEDIRVIVRDLKTFKESKEYKTIASALQNAIDADRETIVAQVEGDECDHKFKYSFHGLKGAENRVFIKFLDDIKTDNAGVSRMKKYINENIEANRKAMVTKLAQYGATYSTVSYTENDKKRFLTVTREILLSIVDDSIASVSPQEESEESKENEEVY